MIIIVIESRMISYRMIVQCDRLLRVPSISHPPSPRHDRVLTLHPERKVSEDVGSRGREEGIGEGESGESGIRRDGGL